MIKISPDSYQGETIRKELSEKSLVQSTKFNWEKSAQLIEKAIFKTID